ncbi:KIR protein [Plasmodium coatneyi]|uniref:KIR protein n=1 Tax=Plasmodium coatneyi TaxID=208452 RepID=A0A1B1DW25_9APIC|nr:KIR protein [Plasmodium coatneyi]ANQ06954.1 KIR protein [Plasmodium coatneyi]
MVNAECSEDDLPSRKVYAALEKRGKHTCTEISSWTQQIEEILDKKLSNQWQHEAGEYATKFSQAWCLVSKMNTAVGQPCERVCDFFYFWLGDMLSDKLSGWTTEPEVVIQSIYTKLNGVSNNELCANTFLSSNMDTSFLQRRKKVFDYWHDYRTIWKQLKECGSSCNGAYDTYLNGVKEKGEDGGADGAYSMVSANCGSGEHANNNDSFCTDFWNKKFKQKVHGDGSNPIPKPGDLKSKAMEEGQDPPSETEDEKNLNSCFEQLSSTVSSSLPQEAIIFYLLGLVTNLHLEDDHLLDE